MPKFLEKKTLCNTSMALNLLQPAAFWNIVVAHVLPCFLDATYLWLTNQRDTSERYFRPRAKPLKLVGYKITIDAIMSQWEYLLGGPAKTNLFKCLTYLTDCTYQSPEMLNKYLLINIMTRLVRCGVSTNMDIVAWCLEHNNSRIHFI